MSYSFSVRGSDRAAVMAKVTEEFEKVVASQPEHVKDRVAAQNTVAVFLAIPSKRDDQDYSVSVGGSLSWNDDKETQSASVNVSVSVVAKS